MKLQDNTDTFFIKPLRDGEQLWLAIGKNGIQVGNPTLDANAIVALIKELKSALNSLIDR